MVNCLSQKEVGYHSLVSFRLFERHAIEIPNLTCSIYNIYWSQLLSCKTLEI